ncbi:MAG: FtsX-like permease family protein [Chitinispirillales bacterium]|jgi:ABC-type lipoprotein release transport system permease subunit|nr:FtsX-like permease family protein [Chitinispirillales bacterium]
MSLNGIWELKKIALRNLARHKVKTVLTSAAIMISVAVYIFMSSWLGGMAVESRRNIVNYDMSAAKLQTKLYFERKDELPSYENFKNWERYRDALNREGFNAAPRFVFNGTLFSNSGSAPMRFNAVDPAAEKSVLHYASYVDFGRYPQNGMFELAIGTTAAEKLRVGIPTRPRRLELEELIRQAAQSDTPNEEFIRSLYETANMSGGLFNVAAETHIAGNERMALKRNVSRGDLDRLWELIAATDRNNVRINAVIDIKAVPETIRPTLWEGELMTSLREEDKELVEAAYTYEEFIGVYLLTEEDEARKDQILSAMIRAGFRGAVRHVNQLVDAVVVGVINSPDPVPNGNIGYIPIDVLQDESGMMLEGAVTELLIRRKDAPYTELPGADESSKAIAAALERGLGEPLPDYLAVFFWMDYMKDYLGYEALQTTAPQVLAALLLFISFLGISNTILLAVLERTKEIGMMRALGMTDRQMITAYMLEAGFLGFIGSVLGMILGCIVNYPMVEYGLNISAMADSLGNSGVGFRVTAIMRSVWNIPVIFGSGITATVLASFMAYFPTRRAVKMPITDSLRFE